MSTNNLYIEIFFFLSRDRNRSTNVESGKTGQSRSEEIYSSANYWIQWAKATHQMSGKWNRNPFNVFGQSAKGSGRIETKAYRCNGQDFGPQTKISRSESHHIACTHKQTHKYCTNLHAWTDDAIMFSSAISISDHRQTGNNTKSWRSIVARRRGIAKQIREYASARIGTDTIQRTIERTVVSDANATKPVESYEYSRLRIRSRWALQRIFFAWKPLESEE